MTMAILSFMVCCSSFLVMSGVFLSSWPEVGCDEVLPLLKTSSPPTYSADEGKAQKNISLNSRILFKKIKKNSFLRSKRKRRVENDRSVEIFRSSTMPPSLNPPRVADRSESIKKLDDILDKGELISTPVIPETVSYTARPSEPIGDALRSYDSNISIETSTSHPMLHLNENTINVSPQSEHSSTHNHIDLDVIEHELEAKKDTPNKGLLLAISILQHHTVPAITDEVQESRTPETAETKQTLDAVQIANESSINLSNTNDFGTYHHNTTNSFTYSVEINDLFTSKQESPEELYREDDNFQHTTDSVLNDGSSAKSDAPSGKFHWFVLVMDGDCNIIRHRMSAFVTFLKAALSAKLKTRYEDIFVPSVFCDKSFMVNITIDTGKYPSAPITLHNMAEANTTLLEISGEIFYLEKILVKKPKSEIKTNAYLRRNGDVEIVIYIAVGSMCFSIFLSVVTAFLVRICRQEDDILPIEKRECYERPDYSARQPTVIYSPTFSQGLDIEKHCHRSEQDNADNNVSGIAPSSSGSLNYVRYNSERERDGGSEQYTERKSLISTSKLKLLEEVQEEDEDEVVDEYHQNEDTEIEEDMEDMVELDDDDDDADICESAEEQHFITPIPTHSCVEIISERENCGSPVLHDTLRPFCLSTTTPNDPTRNLSFDNPCYDR